MKRLQFSLGPVQSFVSQARRTRDLWAGSFLLSYLTGHAMQALLAHGGHIKFPVVTDSSTNISDPLLRAIYTHARTSGASAKPYVGSLPNRFVAQVPDTFQPLWCTEAIHNQWNALANTVWTHFIEAVRALGQDTQTIWTRQVANFWEITWVMGEEPDLLDRRKNWRTQSYPGEMGRKCSMMPQWQEISGHVRDDQAREKFWQALRKNLRFELQDGEELSAIALVKRLFPLVAKEAIGWPIPLSYRSTVDLAATSWITHTCRTQPQVCQAYAEAGQQFVRSKDVKSLPLSWQRLITDNPRVKSFMQMDGNSLYANTLLNDRLWNDDESRSVREQLIKKLQEFNSSPDTYFAILLMDGDHLGRLLKEHSPRTISEALKNFTQKVPDIVKERNGELIYAGGDDVLALFPLEDALAASSSLREVYANAMKGTGTISAAIVYAHYHAPLTELIRYAHHLLDHIAKEQNERDSLVLSVMTSAGPSRTWATKWDVLQTSSFNRLEHLAAQVQSAKAMSSQFLVKISELESKLGYQIFPDDDFWQHLFVYELGRSHPEKSLDKQEAQAQRQAHKTISQMIVELSHGYRVNSDSSRYRDLLSLIHFLSKRMRSDV